MADQDFLAQRFEAERSRLTAVAYRMLGSAAEADDAVQEAWLRLSRTDTGEIQNLTAWLTTVVGRVCLDLLRSRRTRSEAPLESADPLADDDPEREAMLADSVGLALLIVLDTLGPAERLAFVLHDMFAVPFEDIAPIVGRTPEAARQLASRARRRVQGVDVHRESDIARQREVVDAFLAASRDGDFDALLSLLDPGVTVRADSVAVGLGGSPEVRGAQTVAAYFSGRARGARPMLIDGEPSAGVWSGGGLRIGLVFTVDDGRVTGIEVIADPATIGDLTVELLPQP